MHKLRPGDRVHHRRRAQSGTYMGKVDASGDTVLVDFGDGEEKVSRDQLAKEAS